ncbi:SDR family oxidoreductase [Sphingobium phenoxybenzoativorans]|uniref:SDR family oxidoreductase n=1 Tax=Sphingobium phenoxybenzoativorans TaxID=1592790 RepID=UPI0009F71EA4|nr:SDR family oxidoreductase [Sphingobium phenoxybenzoativorans]
MGRATALAFARQGTRVMIADRDEAGGRETVSMIEALGGQARFRKTDVAHESEVKAVIDEGVSAFGTIEFAVNCAGITQPALPLLEQPDDLYDRLFDVNTKGVWLCMRHQLAHMVQQGKGAIVNVASAAGRIAQASLSTYCGSKFAVVGLTGSVAREYAGAGIRINGIGPGAIDTPIVSQYLANNPNALDPILAKHPIGRMGLPEEIAEAALWLCSDGSSFVVGHMLMVDGGFSTY